MTTPRAPHLRGSRAPSTLAALAVLSLFAMGGHLLVGPGQEPGTADELPAGVLARLGGEDITRAEYAEHLLVTFGLGPLDELVERRLVEREAARLGLTWDPARLAAAWSDEWTAHLARARGDAALAEAEMQRVGFTVASWRARFEDAQRTLLLEEAIILADRTPDEEQLLERFRMLHGEDGLRVELRHLLLNRARLKGQLERSGAAPEELTVDALDRELERRALALLAELRAGADFETVARRESHDLSVHQNGGLIPGYDFKHYGPAVAAAARSAAVGVPTGPVSTTAGVHLLLVEARIETKLEDVRDELMAELLTAPATYGERTTLRARLRQEAGVVQRRALDG